MSLLFGTFLIAFLSSLLYNKFDQKSRPEMTKKEKNTFEKSYSQEGNENTEFGFNSKDIHELDVCIFKVVAGNQKLCEVKNEENLNRLASLLIPCHAENIGNNLEIMKVVEKRTSAVCEEVSQQMFMINSQRRVKALVETAQLHSSLITSYKANQKLLESITSETLSRLRVQRVAFMKNMRKFKKHFMKNESLFLEAARGHLLLLASHKEFIGGLQKDVKVFTEGFLHSSETRQENFTAFSLKIFKKHSEIMMNLNRVENTTDRILRQLEMIEKYNYTVKLKNATEWIARIFLVNQEEIISITTSCLFAYVSMPRHGILKRIKFASLALSIAGVFLRYKYSGLFIATWLFIFITEVTIWCLSFFLDAGGTASSSSQNNTFISDQSSSELSRRAVSVLNDSLGYQSSSGDSRVMESTTMDTRSESGSRRDILGHGAGDVENIASRASSVFEGRENTTRDTSMQSDTSSNALKIASNSSMAIETEDQCVHLAKHRDNLEHDSARVHIIDSHGQPSTNIQGQLSTNLDIQRQHKTRQRASYSDIKRDKIPQRGVQTRRMRCASSDHPQKHSMVERKNVQTSTTSDSEVQTGSTKDITTTTNTDNQKQTKSGCDEVQMSTQDDNPIRAEIDMDIHEELTSRHGIDKGQSCTSNDNKLLQTGHFDDDWVQSSSRYDSQVQAENFDDEWLQSCTRYSSQVQTESLDDIWVQSSTRLDTEYQTLAKYDSQTQTSSDTEAQASTSGNNYEHPGTHAKIQGKKARDIWSQDSGITCDFGEPHEPLGLKEGTTQGHSRIIVNIGDRRQSRNSSPYEILQGTSGEVRRYSSTYDDSNSGHMADSPLHSVSEEETTIQVNINEPSASGMKQACGHMTLQGTPCKRIVGIGQRCRAHRYTR